MLKMHIDLKGLPSKKFIRKAQFRADYFDNDCNFMCSRFKVGVAQSRK